MTTASATQPGRRKAASAALIIPGVPVHERRRSRVLQSPLAAPRLGVMLHYDDSERDEWSLAWFRDPRCTNGYTWLVLDAGRVVELANPARRTPHAGACITPNANSAFYGLSAATNGLVPVTTPQFDAIVATCVALFRFHGWTAADASVKIRGHNEEAIWTPSNTRAAGLSDAKGRKLWNRTGRKVDPVGVRTDRLPIIDIARVRVAVARTLAGGQGGRDDARL